MADIYEDARRYVAMTEQHFASGDVAYWKAQAAYANGAVLELACGAGRLALPIAADSVEIAGLDTSASMLELARERAAKLDLPIQWYQADMSDFDLGQQYALIFLPNNSVAHLLTWQDFGRCLGCVRQHLAAGGRFMLDYFNPALGLLSRDPERHFPVGTFNAPDGSGQIIVSEQSAYDTARQINQIRWFWRTETTGAEEITEFSMRVYFPQELDALLFSHGFTIEAKYGDYNLSPFTSASRHQLIVAEAL